MSDTELQLGVIRGQACACNRFADAMVRMLGGAQVTLRIADPSSGDNRSQLGLEPPPFEDLQIFPAVLTGLDPAADGSKRIQVTLPASAIDPFAKSHNVVDIASWLLSAQGVLHHDQLMRIDSVVADHALGSVCLYRITARE
jgi:hypothetical protein